MSAAVDLRQAQVDAWVASVIAEIRADSVLPFDTTPASPANDDDEHDDDAAIEAQLRADWIARERSLVVRIGQFKAECPVPQTDSDRELHALIASHEAGLRDECARANFERVANSERVQPQKLVSKFRTASRAISDRKALSHRDIIAKESLFLNVLDEKWQSAVLPHRPRDLSVIIRSPLQSGAVSKFRTKTGVAKIDTFRPREMHKRFIRAPEPDRASPELTLTYCIESLAIEGRAQAVTIVLGPQLKGQLDRCLSDAARSELVSRLLQRKLENGLGLARGELDLAVVVDFKAGKLGWHVHSVLGLTAAHRKEAAQIIRRAVGEFSTDEARNKQVMIRDITSRGWAQYMSDKGRGFYANQGLRRKARSLLKIDADFVN